MDKDMKNDKASVSAETESSNGKDVNKAQEKDIVLASKEVKTQQKDDITKGNIENGTKGNQARAEAQSEKQAINTTVKSRADSQEVKVNNDIKAENTKIPKEMPNAKSEAEKALKKAEEKTAFKGLKKVGAYAAGALALVGLTSALIGTKGQQTNDQLYGQQPLY